MLAGQAGEIARNLSARRDGSAGLGVEQAHIAPRAGEDDGPSPADKPATDDGDATAHDRRYAAIDPAVGGSALGQMERIEFAFIITPSRSARPARRGLGRFCGPFFIGGPSSAGTHADRDQ